MLIIFIFTNNFNFEINNGRDYSDKQVDSERAFTTANFLAEVSLLGKDFKYQRKLVLPPLRRNSRKHTWICSRFIT